MADVTKSAEDALASADEFAARMGIQEQTPEVTAGSQSFLEKMFPGLSAKMAGASEEEKAELARAAVQAQAESDPDSILSIFGLDAMKEMVQNVVNRVTGDVQSTREAQVQAGDPNLGPATAQQGTQALQEDPRFRDQ